MRPGVLGADCVSLGGVGSGSNSPFITEMVITYQVVLVHAYTSMIWTGWERNTGSENDDCALDAYGMLRAQCG